jgi:hypothetical protein
MEFGQLFCMSRVPARRNNKKPDAGTDVEPTASTNEEPDKGYNKLPSAIKPEVYTTLQWPPTRSYS